MAKITKEMTLGEVVKGYPSTAEIFFKYGMHCIGCHVSAFETVEQGAKAHGMDDKQLAKMLAELNNSVQKKEK